MLSDGSVQPQTYLCDLKITEVSRNSSDSTKSKTPTEMVEIKRERESVTWCQEGHTQNTESKNPVICSPIYSEDEIKNE